MKAVLGLFLVLILTASCGNPDEEVPETICGTRINSSSVRQLVSPRRDLHEFTRVERSEAVSAPCKLFSGKVPVLDFNFYWTADSPDLVRLTKSDQLLFNISEPRSVRLARQTVIGNNGALSTTPCKTKGGNYFTLTLQLPQVRQQDRTHRKDIERFMRAYFPATLKTLGCTGPRI